MTSFRYVAVLAAIIVIACVRPLAISGQAIAQASSLKIVIISGEDAVNIIQQKTAVAPIVEVRDRNDQPVAGAIVRFAIQGGRATFGGAQTLTVTTNAVGQAVATGLTPTASGALQVSASAAFQGQTAAAVTIAQTNVMTAAQAAAVSGASGAGGAGGSSGGAAAGSGAAGGGGGGMSLTTIGLIGGAVAGGAVVATQVAGGEEAAGAQSYSGPFSFDWVVGCLVERLTGTITVDLIASSDTPETPVSDGRLDLSNTMSVVVSRPANCSILTGGTWGMPGAPVTGTLGSFAAHGQDTVTSLVGTPLQRNYDFRGALSNGLVSGTFEMTWRNVGPPVLQSSGTSVVTLNRVGR